MVQSFELAFRMQSAAPSVLDLAGESAATLKLYGIGTPATDDFGRQCLLARRFAEPGVRFVQISTGVPVGPAREPGERPREDRPRRRPADRRAARPT